jgi:hypothetical protein
LAQHAISREEFRRHEETTR